MFGRRPMVLRERPAAWSGPVVVLGKGGNWRHQADRDIPVGEESFLLATRHAAAGQPALVASGAGKPLDAEVLGKAGEWLRFSSENRQAVQSLAGKAEVLQARVPSDRRDFYQGHVLTQIQIHLQSLVSLEAACRAVLAYEDGDRDPVHHTNHIDQYQKPFPRFRFPGGWRTSAMAGIGNGVPHAGTSGLTR